MQDERKLLTVHIHKIAYINLLTYSAQGMLKLHTDESIQYMIILIHFKVYS